MVLTDDEELYYRLRELRDHGMSRHRKYVHVVQGFNYRMTNMQAAIGLAQLERFEKILQRRQQQEDYYERLLSSVNQLSFRPKQDWAETVHWMMTIRFKKEGIRDRMLEFLTQRSIDCRQMIFPVHHAKHFKAHFDRRSFPVSEQVSMNSLHLPSSTNLSPESIEYIAGNVIKGLELYG